jgi:putative SOS response-associated peptidase YedK
VAILTTAANDLAAPCQDRMPVILSPGQFAAWLAPREQRPAELLPLLVTYPPGRMEYWPVGSRVNAVKGEDDAGLIERVMGPRRGSTVQPSLFG